MLIPKDVEHLAIVRAVAGEIKNDETTSTPTFTDEYDIQDVKEIVFSLEDFLLDTETSLDIYPQIADKLGSWRYLVDSAGAVLVFNVTGATRKARQLLPFEVRGIRFRALVGSTGTQGNGTMKLDIMRFQEFGR